MNKIFGKCCSCFVLYLLIHKLTGLSPLGLMSVIMLDLFSPDFFGHWSAQVQTLYFQSGIVALRFCSASD